MVDGSVVIVTVDHLIPSIMAAEEAVTITHPSEQENILFHTHGFLLRVDALQLCCPSCKILANEHSKPVEESQLLIHHITSAKMLDCIGMQSRRCILHNQSQ